MTWDSLNRLEVGHVHFRPIQWAPDSGFVYTSVQGPFMIKLILLHSAGSPESVAPSFVQKFHRKAYPLEFFSVGKKSFSNLLETLDSDRGHPFEGFFGRERSFFQKVLCLCASGP